RAGGVARDRLHRPLPFDQPGARCKQGLLRSHDHLVPVRLRVPDRRRRRAGDPRRRLGPPRTRSRVLRFAAVQKGEPPTDACGTSAGARRRFGLGSALLVVFAAACAASEPGGTPDGGGTTGSAGAGTAGTAGTTGAAGTSAPGTAGTTGTGTAGTTGGGGT